MNAHDQFTNWIRSERDRFNDRDNNVFAIGFSDVARCRRFLSVILSRHNSAASAFIANTRTILERTKSGKMTTNQEDWWQLHLQDVKLVDAIHLEIESYYLVAKILLDKPE